MADPLIAPGDYYIFPSAKTAYCFNIPYAHMSDGENVEIAEWAGSNNGGSSDAQIFNVSYRSDGSMQIVSMIAGKSLDIPGGNIVANNVQIWTDNDTRAQKWTPEATGVNVTINGTSYPTYFIKVTADQKFRITFNTSTNNVGVRNYNDPAESSRAQYYRWAFVPVPIFHSGGLYEIVPVESTGMRIDVSYGSSTNGANVQLYTKNNTNNQKFIFTDTGAGWYIRNVASRKMVDIKGGVIADKTNVQSYEQTESGRSQLWDITQYAETMTINGKTCQVVRIQPHVDNRFSMDVASSGQYKPRTNVQIWTNGNQRNQLFALYPTNATDPYMPSPYNMGFAEVIAGPVKDMFYIPIGNSQSGTKTYFPAWYSVDAWANGGANSFHWRYRKRKMASVNSTWEPWESYSSWATAKVTRSGQRYDITQGLTVTFTEDDDTKAYQYEFQVRSAGPADLGLKLLTGPAVSKTVTIYRESSVTLSNPQLCKEGLKFDYSTNYPSGTSVVNVLSIIGDDDTVYLDHQYRGKQQSTATEFIIPWSMLKAIPAEGAVFTMQATVGTDLYESSMKTFTYPDLEVSYAEYADAQVTYTDGLAKTITANVNASYSNPHVFIIAKGSMFECDMIPETETLAQHGYMVPYPFGSDYDIYITGYIDSVWYFQHDVKHSDTPPVHAWNYNGVGCILQCRPDEYLATDSQINSVNEEQTLLSRDWSYVQFTHGRKGSFTADGAVIDGVTESSYKAFEQLVGKHAIYRSVSGDICWVAITDVRRKTDYLYSTINVTMKRESL